MTEELVFFPCGGGATTMAGVHTIPTTRNGIAVLIPWGAGAFPSSARNQFRARLAREFAAEGYHSFRFDYPGVGEADGEYKTPTMSTPYKDEIVAAAAWLNSQGLSRLVIVANCFGAWSSLVAAPVIPGLEGVALINCPVHRDHTEVRGGDASWNWWASRLKHLRWSNLRSVRHRARYRKLVVAKMSSLLRSRPNDGRFAGAIEYVFRARIPVLMMYGPDGFRGDFDVALGRGLGSTIDAASPHAKILMVAERLEGMPTLAAQDLLVDTLKTWLHDASEPTFPELAGAAGVINDATDDSQPIQSPVRE